MFPSQGAVTVTSMFTGFFAKLQKRNFLAVAGGVFCNEFHEGHTNLQFSEEYRRNTTLSSYLGITHSGVAFVPIMQFFRRSRNLDRASERVHVGDWPPVESDHNVIAQG